MAQRAATRDAVLVPATYSPVGYTCVRSLARRGLRPIVVSEHERVPAGRSRFCDEYVRICSPYEDLLGYRDELLTLAAQPRVRTILPLRPADPYVLTTYGEAFERHVSLCVPSAESLRRINDRVALYETAVDAGVPVPKTWRFEAFDGWDDAVVVKSRYNHLTAAQIPSYTESKSSTQSDVIHVPAGRDPDPEAIRSTMKHSPIVQEYVRNDDQYVFAALCDRGTTVATFQHRQIRGDSYTGGGGVYRESIDDPALERVGRRLLDALEWHGVACVEYAKDTATGEYKLLELNPRFWKSLPTAVRAGADFPAYYCHLATGRPPAINPGYKRGVSTHSLYGELHHLLSLRYDESAIVDRPSVPATAWRIIESCLRSPNFDMARLDDPVPFVCGLRWAARNAIRGSLP
ncbi:carboxylate--amine ligase [Natronolimnohabitans innermongolicus]|uniref:ATP-grasp domain-containing protein n=1 Tax=Natronolimnohabitans innermongolicus JCM 12255 TaxID=1227499 RepID=L9XG80_9EURY|nr:hypothetical protein [Natronolimnohabitans innermongolicus]ELY60739.1 hypothetical protein C493_03512 [Natronolimnohabitans innermongolicus JCM 12255]